MFKFLFGGGKAKAQPESHRERFKRLVGELNDLIETLPAKPRVTFDPETGFILPEMPEQFADEALALPAPAKGAAKDPLAEASTPARDAKPVANPAVTEGDAVASTPKAAVPPAASTTKPGAEAAPRANSGA